MAKEKQHLFLEGLPRLALTEWVPTGTHFVCSLQRRFGCAVSARRQNDGEVSHSTGYYITGVVDSEPNSAVLDVPDAEVALRVADYCHMEYIRLDAKISFGDSAEWQDESVGFEVAHDRRLSYGAELSRRESLDRIALILADLADDTSRVMDTVLNSYQRRILDIVFSGQSRHRDKFVVLVGESVTARDKRELGRDELLATAAWRANLRQILGRLCDEASVDLPEDGFVIIGETGLLLVSRRPERYYEMIQLLALMNSMDVFLRNTFSRIAWQWDCLDELRKRIACGHANEVMEFQVRLSELSAQQGLLQAIPTHLRRDVPQARHRIESGRIADSAQEAGLVFFEETSRLSASMDERLDAADHAIATVGKEIENVRMLASTLSEKETYGINRAMNVLTVVSVIVLPLTLITGIYGMNFVGRAPDGTMVSRFNMPELYWKYGYLFTLAMMALVGISLYSLFRKRGLLGAGK